MSKIRVLVVIGLVAASLVVVFVGRPMDDVDSEVTSVLLDAELNNNRAEGAPQQQVVNGWTARDMAALHARQLDSINQTLWGVAWLIAIAAALLSWQILEVRAEPDASDDVVQPEQRASEEPQ